MKIPGAIGDSPGEASLPASCRIVGAVTASSDLRVEGVVEGTIAAVGHRLTIAEGARVQANLRAAEILVRGEVEGSADGSVRIAVSATGTLRGPACAPKLALEEGALFAGSYTDEPAPADPNAVAEIDQALRAMLGSSRP